MIRGSNWIYFQKELAKEVIETWPGHRGLYTASQLSEKSRVRCWLWDAIVENAIVTTSYLD
jgi:hypothetical protein